MKKTVTFFLISMALMLGISSKAQPLQLTISDEIDTNNMIPFNWEYLGDCTHHSQIIYPASEISPLLIGAEITKAIFYLSSNIGRVPQKPQLAMKMMNTTETIVPNELIDVLAATTVCSGVLSVSGNQLIFNFKAPFVYTGDNLLIDFTITIIKNSTYQTNSFYGKNTTVYYNSRLHLFKMISDSTVNFGEAFVPKLTVEYIPSIPLERGFDSRRLHKT